MQFLFCLVFLLISITNLQGQDTNTDVDTSPDTCRCYCCPSPANPGYAIAKKSKCDINNPPLIGTVPIGGGAGPLACNAQTCNSYFFESCPPNLYKDVSGAAVRAGFRSCPDGN
jgi:hypothetical protein